MADRRILHLSPAGLAAWAPGTSAAETTFPADPEGHARFAGYLAAHTRTRFTILIDLSDEIFSVETLPPLRGRDRQRLLARRQERIGATSPYLTSLSLGRTLGSPPEERILFAALTRPENLDPWFDALIQAGAIVSGIHSIPFVSTALLAHLPGTASPSTAPQLLASLGPAGLRVSCYVASQLRFSRLTPTGAEPWAACAQELQRTRQYLYAQRILTRDTPHHTQVLAHPDHHADIRAATADSIDCIDLTALAHTCGAPPPVGSDSLPLLIHLLARSRRLPAIDAPALGRARRILRASHVAILGTALAVGAGIALTAANYATSLERDTENTQLRAHIADAQRRVEHLRATMPVAPHSPADIHAAHAQAIRLHAAANIEGPLQAISRVFDHFSQIDLERLEWALTPTDPDPALTIRLQVTLPVPGANSRAEAFALALRTATQAAVSIEPSAPTPQGPTEATSARQHIALRLDFPQSAR